VRVESQGLLGLCITSKSFLNGVINVSYIFSDQFLRKMLESVGHVDENILARMKTRFGTQVTLALQLRDVRLMVETYEKAQRLPSTMTTQHLESRGFVLDGDLFLGNEQILLAFRKIDGAPHAMKIATEAEFYKVKAWSDAIRNEVYISNFILGHILEEHSHKYFMFSPLYPVTLEHAPFLTNPAVVQKFYNHVTDALLCFHEHGFIHNDIKPSNIFITTGGDYIVGDLGSLSRKGVRSESTQAYVPDDMWDSSRGRISQLAHESTDWWMLTMTLYEKACGGGVGVEARERTTRELRLSLFPELNTAASPVFMSVVGNDVIVDLGRRLHESDPRGASANSGSI
jgi:hypothetical protein